MEWTSRHKGLGRTGECIVGCWFKVVGGGGSLVSCVAPSSEELWVRKEIIDQNALL